MTENFDPQEVALLIRGRQILKAKGLASGADVKTICEAAGVSRKTGYQWANSRIDLSNKQDKALEEELAQLKAENQELKERCRRLEFENEGRKLAWEIHGVDELLAAKKNTIQRPKKKRR